MGETTDIDVVNVINGIWEKECPGETFLLNAEALEKANNSTIPKLFDEPMWLLWKGGIKHDNKILFLCDAAPYIVKTRENIKLKKVYKIIGT